MLSGHEVQGRDQIVLGPATLAELHKSVGDTVTASYGSARDAPVFVPPTRLTVVGSSTMPTIGFSSIIGDHTSMGTGAVVSSSVEPAAMQRAVQQPDPNLNGPDVVFVRLRASVSKAEAEQVMARVVKVGDHTFATDPQTPGITISTLAAQRPAEIVNYRSMGATPELLALGLALGAIVALGLALTASVRWRRSDLVVLKTLGFTHRQLAGTVAWQASVVAVVGIAVGVPVGVALGRQLWILFATSIYAVPEPAVPVAGVAVVVAATLVLANLVAAIPGRMAARTSVAYIGRLD